MFSNIRIVLVQTSHPGNIGATARAMKNMRLESLYLVEPQRFPDAEATSRASGADDILAAATVVDSLEQALVGCRLVVGASARQRSIAWSQLDPRRCGEQLVAESALGPVALVFGREQSGLSNAELDLCHALVHIPTNPDYSSLNVAAAVQVLAYEVLMAHGPAMLAPLPEPEQPLASADEMERFYLHMEQTLVQLEFLDPQKPRHLMRRVRRLFNRARPDLNEMNILRGILSAAQDKAKPPGE